MKKVTHIFITAVTAISLLTSCNEEMKTIIIEDEIPESVTPPGLEYTQEGEACLNVFYAIPADLDSIRGWHHRLSGITLHMQDYYKKNFVEAGYGEKTFNLEVNKANPEYIKIHYLPLEKTTDATKEEMSLHVMSKATEYYHTNQLSSKNSLVYMPEYPIFNAENKPFNGGSDHSTSTVVKEDMGYGILSVDRTDFDIKYLGKPAQVGTLFELGNVMHELGHAFWLQHNDNGLDKKFGMMGNGTYTYLEDPDGVRFSDSDILRMNELDVFKKNSSEDFFTFDPWDLTLGINGNKEAKVQYDSTSGDVLIHWNFKSIKKVVGFMAYVDPWGKDVEADRNYNDVVSEYDAITYLASKEEFTNSGDNYAVNMRINWEDFLSRNKTYLNLKDGEVRFRIIFEGGVTLPVSGSYDNKGPLPENNLEKTAYIRFYFEIKDGVPAF